MSLKVPPFGTVIYLRAMEWISNDFGTPRLVKIHSDPVHFTERSYRSVHCPMRPASAACS